MFSRSELHVKDVCLARPSSNSENKVVGSLGFLNSCLGFVEEISKRPMMNR
jgi:hypothetical protein